MAETAVTQVWMAGVVLMMLIFAGFAVAGYLIRKSKSRSR